MRYPIRQQLLLPLLAVAVGSLAAVGGLIAWWVTASTEARIERQIAGVVRVLADPRFPLSQPVLEQMRDLSASEFVVTDARHNLLATSGPLLAGDEPTRELSRNAEQIELGPRISIDGHGFYHSSLRLVSTSGDRGPAILHVLYPTDEYDAAWRTAFALPLLVGLVSVTAVLVVVTLLASRLSSITRRLGGDVQRLAQGDFAEVSLPARDDELRDLAIAIDQTARQLQVYEQHVRQTEQLNTANMLGAALAHEMRNAATGCRIALDLHAQNLSPDASDESLDVAHKQLTLMETRLRRFLQLAQPAKSDPRTTVDVVSLLSEAIALVQPMARHANVALGWTAPDEPQNANLDGDGLLQTVLNLLLNAIEAVRGRSSAKVELTLSSSSEGLQICVADSGPGPSATIAEKIFEPFVTDKREGAGLGLAGVRQFAQSHGGVVEWIHEDEWTRFVVTLPLGPGE